MLPHRARILMRADCPYPRSAIAMPGMVSTLALALLAVAFFSRVVVAMGAPAVVNFLHFGFAVGFVALIIPRIRSIVSIELLLLLLLLLSAISLSALLNGAGLINVILDFLLLSEPFLLLLLLIHEPMLPRQLERFRSWVLGFALVHVAFAYYQVAVMGFRGDAVKGVFIAQGAGHHVGGAVALTAAVYFFATSRIRSLFVRVCIGVLGVGVTWLSGSKQVVLVFLVSLLALSLLRLGNVKKAVRYVVMSVAAGVVLLWAAGTVWPGLKSHANLERVQWGLQQKFSGFPVMASYHRGPLHWIVGLGPGHTVGRLAKILPDYYERLEPIGATVSPVTREVRTSPEGYWMLGAGIESSLWQPFFSWAGIWGDLGLLGLCVFVSLWFVVWRRLCRDDLARFLMLNILAFGAVFGWLEEPGYMLFVVALIGLQWQQRRSATAVVRVGEAGARP